MCQSNTQQTASSTISVSVADLFSAFGASAELEHLKQKANEAAQTKDRSIVMEANTALIAHLTHPSSNIVSCKTMSLAVDNLDKIMDSVLTDIEDEGITREEKSKFVPVMRDAFDQLSNGFPLESDGGENACGAYEVARQCIAKMEKVKEQIAL